MGPDQARPVVATAALVLALAGTVATQSPFRGSGVRDRMVERDVRVTDVRPEWLALPSEGRVLTSDGIAVRPLQNAGVSYENASLGMLVGALRNVGACARDVYVRLQYTNARWEPLGSPIDNEARVTQLEPGGLLPYRFRLRRTDEFPEPPAGYVLEVAEQGRPVRRGVQWVDADKPPDTTTPCPERPYALDVRLGRHRSGSSSYRVNGDLRVSRGGPLRPDGVMLTALLLDQQGQVLEVLTGAPTVEPGVLRDGLIHDGTDLAFSLATPVPLGKWVKAVEVFAEVLPDARAVQ